MRLKSYKSPKTEVRESPIKGRGLFAKQDIKKGELIFIKSGHIVDKGTAKALEDQLGEYCLQITERFLVCPTTPEEVQNTAIYINHSCNPNVGPDGQVSFIAMRDIAKGEELCTDYAMTTDRNYEMQCDCGSPQCRKVVRGTDWMLSKLQAKYGSYFTDFILKKQGKR